MMAAENNVISERVPIVSSIFKFFRITFFLGLYFVLCMVVVTTMLQKWSDGGQMLFAFGVPIILVWWQETRRSRKAAAKVLAHTDQDGKAAQPTPSAKPSANERRIALEREKARETFADEASARPKSYVPPRQDYAEIVRAGKSAAPAIAGAARRNEVSRASTTARPRSRKSGWVPSNRTASVAGRDIGGMVYFGTPPLLNSDGYRDKCRAYIDPSLSVARIGTDKAGDGMPYWPGYSDISPQCRATYLDWLASGRKDASYNPGYMFLYFYGLERRFFVDQSNEDAKDIVEEVRRLWSLYPDNHSVRRYLGEFLDIAMLAETDFDAIEPVFERQGWELPFSLKYVIGARLDKGEHLNADWVLSWYICHPESSLRTPATRCREEFLALFRMRFEERFPGGLKVNRPRKTLKATYRAASSEFEGTINPTSDGKPVPDISGLRKPVEIAQEIADEVMDSLDKLSRFLGRNPDGRGSVEAHALLPAELWQSFPSEEMDKLKAWANGIVEDSGLVSLASVIERLEGERAQKIGKRQLTSAADALARLGFGLAPDPRFALRSPKPEEPVVLYDLGEPVEKLEEVSTGYRSALMELALGSFVAHADGRIAEPERKALESQVASVTGLTDQERRRIRANLEWFLTVPPDMTLLRRKLKDIDENGQTAMRAALVAAAHADGVIKSEEVASIEKVYKALGLDPSLAYSDLHAGKIADAPRTVRAAQPGRPGEAIPKFEKATGPVLDASRIAAIRSDTERVSSVLGQIFDTEEDQKAAGVSNARSVLPGLDQKNSVLVLELVAREHWTEAAFAQLCERHALMASGALEAVNEWAFENYDEALLDEYDGYDVSPDIAEAVRAKIEGEGSNVETETT